MIDLQNDKGIPVQVDDPVLLRYMLQYLYGLDYVEEPGEYEQEKPEECHEWSRWGRKKESKQYWKKTRTWREDESIPHEEEPIPSEVEPGSSEGISRGGNAVGHAQMCAVADFYDIPDLQEVAQRKFKVALDKVHDNQGIVEIFKLVCNPDFRSDVVLRDSMVGKIVANNKLLDEPDIEEILQEDGQLALKIAKRLRSK